MSKMQYEFLSDQVSGQFLRGWAESTFDVGAEFDDDFAMFFAFDGV